MNKKFHYLHKIPTSRLKEVAICLIKKNIAIKQKRKQSYVPNKAKRQNLRKGLHDMEKIYLSDKGIKIMIIKMFTELGGRMDKHNENFNKEIENNQTEVMS